MKTRRITLIVAVLLAVGTGVITLRYLSSVNQQAVSQQQAGDMKSIVIASRNIPARSIIVPDMLTKTVRLATQIEPQSLSDPKQAIGTVALTSITQGTTLTSTKIGQPAELGITARLQPGLRAVSIPVDRVKNVSNLIQPGDRVDVMASVVRGAGEPPKTFTIIRGAIVLAINSQLEPNGATPAPDSGASPTLTLGVTPQQADLLTVADLNTTLRLALRSPREPVRSLPAEKLVFADLSPAQPASASGAAAAPAPANVPPPIYPAPAPVPLSNVPMPALIPAVTVIDGDKIVAGSR